MEEIEKTYLLRYIPDGLLSSPKKEISDHYFCLNQEKPSLKLRKKENKYRLYKKNRLEKSYLRHQEETINLTTREAKELLKLPNKSIVKTRYYYSYNDIELEIDLFLGELRGLTLADFEFNSEEESKAFTAPDFCLADVTEEVYIFGRVIAGMKYEEVEKYLRKYDYKRLGY